MSESSFRKARERPKVARRLRSPDEYSSGSGSQNVEACERENSSFCRSSKVYRPSGCRRDGTGVEGKNPAYCAKLERGGIHGLRLLRALLKGLVSRGAEQIRGLLGGSCVSEEGGHESF